MKTKVSPAIVGAFVVGAFALGILALLVFGGVSFAPNQRFVVYFNEPVHGLDEGSPVKLRGVRVGRVVDLHVRYDASSGKSTAVVVCQLSPNSILDSRGQVVDISESGRLQDLVNHGLRAQLGVIGLATGTLYVELDFLNPQDHPAEIPSDPSPYPVVPSVLSTISEFQSSASQILGRLQRVDFVGLSDNLKALLVSARQQVDGLDLKGLADQWKNTGQAVEGLAKSPEIPRVLANADSALAELRSTLTELRGALANVDRNVNDNGRELQVAIARLQQTLKDFDATAVTVRRFVAAQQDVGANANQALQSLSSAADSVQRLADYLERNPNALLAGRAPTP